MPKLREDAGSDTVSVAEASRQIGLGINQTYEAIHRGDIPAIKVGRRWLVLRRPLERMLGKTEAAE